jgi:TonB family protein
VPVVLLLWLLGSALFSAQEAPLVAGSEGVPLPKAKNIVKPVYPQEALAQGIRGIVILDLVIDEQGRVEDVSIIRSIPGLDEAAVAAARQWQYEPVRVDGRAVKVRLTVPITFALKLPEVSRQAGIPELRQGVIPKSPEGTRSGRAVAEVTLDPDGRIGIARILEGEEPWATALLQALRTWRFATPPDDVSLSFRVAADFAASHGQEGGPVRLRLEGLQESSLLAPATGGAGGNAAAASPGGGTEPQPGASGRQASEAPESPSKAEGASANAPAEGPSAGAETPADVAQGPASPPQTSGPPPAGPDATKPAPAPAGAPTGTASAAPPAAGNASAPPASAGAPVSGPTPATEPAAPVAGPAGAPAATAPPAAPAGPPATAPPASAGAPVSGPTPATEPAAPAAGPAGAPAATAPPAVPTGPPATVPSPAGPAAGAPPAGSVPPAAGAAGPAAPPPVEVVTVPPPPLPPENGISAIRGVTLEPGVPDLTQGRRPVAPPLARMSGAVGQVQVDFSVGPGGITTVQEVRGPQILQAAARGAVETWAFRRTRAERLYLTATFTYDADTASADIHPQALP